MTDILIKRTHELGAEKGRDIATSMAESLRRDHGLDYSWRDSVLHFSGPGVDGRLAVGESALTLEISLGWAARPFRRRLEAAIDARLDELLNA